MTFFFISSWALFDVRPDQARTCPILASSLFSRVYPIIQVVLFPLSLMFVYL